MPLESSKVKDKKSKIARKKRTGFPNEKIVSLHLAKCAKHSQLDMVTKLKYYNQSNKKKVAMKDQQRRKSSEVEEECTMVSTSNVSTVETSAAVSKKKIKKNAQKKKRKVCKPAAKSFTRAFKYFSRLGETYSVYEQNWTISYPKTLWWLKKAEIVDNHRVTIRDVEVHFINQLKSGYELKILEFIQFLRSLCEDRCLQMRTVLTKLKACRKQKIKVSTQASGLYNNKIIRGYKFQPVYRKGKDAFPLIRQKQKLKVKKGSKVAKKKSDNQVCEENVGQIPYPEPYVIPTNICNNHSFSKFTNKSTYPMHKNFQKSTGSNFQTGSPFLLYPPLIPIPFENEFLEDLTPEQTLSNQQVQIISNLESLERLKFNEKYLLKDKQNKPVSENFPNISELDVCNLGLNAELLEHFNGDNYEYVSSDSSSSGIMYHQIRSEKSRNSDELRDLLAEGAKDNLKEQKIKLKKSTKEKDNLDFNKQNRSEETEIIDILSFGTETSYKNNSGQEKNSLHSKKPTCNEEMNQKASNSVFSIANKTSKIAEDSIGNTEDALNSNSLTAEMKDFCPYRKKSINDTKYPKASLSAKQKRNVSKPEKINSLKNSVKSGIANNSQQETSSSTKREGKSQRTFTNLPVWKVQKALSHARKQKTVVVLKNLNPNLDSDCIELEQKRNQKDSSKKNKNVVNTKTNIDIKLTDNKSADKMSKAVEATEFCKKVTGEANRKAMNKTSVVKVSTTKSKKNKKRNANICTDSPEIHKAGKKVQLPRKNIQESETPVQKKEKIALSHARKQKAIVTPKNLNPKLNSDCIKLGLKRNPKDSSSKEQKKLVNSKPNIDTRLTDNQPANNKISKADEVTDFSKKMTGSKSNRKAMNKTSVVKASTTQSKKNKI